MPIELRAILDFFKDYIGKIMIVIGVFFVSLAIPLMTRVYQWFSLFSFLFGITLAVFGVALHYESLKWKVPSVGGFGTILIYVSVIFIAAAMITAFFTVPTGMVRVPSFDSYSALDEHGSPIASVSRTKDSIVIRLERPHAWLATPLILTGLSLLALGFLLKFARDAL